MDRSADLVAHDLEEGKITEDHARSVYGFSGTPVEDRSSTGSSAHA